MSGFFDVRCQLANARGADIARMRGPHMYRSNTIMRRQIQFFDAKNEFNSIPTSTGNMTEIDMLRERDMREARENARMRECERHARDMREICERYARDIREISERYPRMRECENLRILVKISLH